MRHQIGLVREAEISDCGKFRWSLTRQWSTGPSVCFVMLNPSKADAEQDDPTITRCINFAKAWGFGMLIVRNLYPYRATKPSDLKLAMKSMDVRGGARGVIELVEASNADLVIAAWGANASQASQDLAIEYLSPTPLWCLGLTHDGRPLHPLMLKGDLLPMPFVRCKGRSWQSHKGDA